MCTVALAGKYGGIGGIAVNCSSSQYSGAAVCQNTLGYVTTLAGGGSTGLHDGTGTQVYMNQPTGIVVDSGGTLYVSDYGNNLIRMINSQGVVSTIGGVYGVTGLVNGIGTNAQFRSPYGLFLDSNHNLYIADAANQCIRMMTTSGAFSTVASVGAVILGLAITTSGTIYAGEQGNVVSVIVSGSRSVLAGTATPNYLDGTGTNAAFRNPGGIALSTSETSLYIGDFGNNMIRLVLTTGKFGTDHHSILT